MVIRNIFIGLTLAWMSVIYGVSVSPSNLLGRLSSFVVQLMDPVVRFVNVDLGIQFINGPVIQDFIMKSAHFGLFATLGFMTGMVVGHFNRSKVKTIVIALAIGVLFSSIVELRTVIIQGGSFQADVLLVDSLGVMKGIASYVGFAVFGARAWTAGKAIVKRRLGSQGELTASDL